MKKYHGMEVIQESENGYLMITYSPGGMGQRYSIRRRITWTPHNNKSWEYVGSYDSITQARRALAKMPDVETVR